MLDNNRRAKILIFPFTAIFLPFFLAFFGLKNLKTTSEGCGGVVFCNLGRTNIVFSGRFPPGPSGAVFLTSHHCTFPRTATGPCRQRSCRHGLFRRCGPQRAACPSDCGTGASRRLSGDRTRGPGIRGFRR